MLAPPKTHMIGAFSRPLTARAIPIAFVVAVTTALLAFYNGPMCPDVSGQFWNAQSMLRGVRLYTDIVEINPPLWFWIALPVEWLAQTLRVRSEPLTVLATAAAVLAAMAAVRRLLDTMPEPKRMVFLVYLAAILLIMPARQLEQREHLALIGAVPYLILAASRSRSDRISPMLAIAIGVSAGLGFALKPHFLAVPVLIECWLMVTLRRAYRPLRPETIALGAAGVSYIAAVLIFARDYLTVTLPLLRAAYGAVGVSFIKSLNLLPVVWLMLVAAVATYHHAIRSNRTPITTALLIGGIGFAIAWGIQHKGWLYHGLPTTGCLALALAAVVAEAGLPANKRVGVFIPALLLLPLLFATVDTELSVNPDNDISPALADLRAGDSFGLVSGSGATTWPALINRGLRLSSRHGQYWMLYSIDANPNDAAIARLGQRVVRETAHDYRCLPPKIIVFTRPGRNDATVKAVTDPYPFFMRDPDFADVLSHYRPWRTGTIYDAWRQITPYGLVDRSSCRRA